MIQRGQAQVTVSAHPGSAGPSSGPAAVVQRQRERAQAAFDAAERLARPGRAGAAPVTALEITGPLALRMYREAAYWASCAAAGSERAPSLAQALAGLPPEVSASLASAPEAQQAARDVLERADVPGHEQAHGEWARDVQLASDFVRALLRHLSAGEERELWLLRRRVLRVTGVGALLLCALVAVVFLPRALRPQLAANAPWRVSSAAPGFPVRGTGGSSLRARAPTLVPDVAAETSLFFHTDMEASPWIEFDLGRVRSLHRLRLVNRADCCWERAAPLVIELSTDRKHYREVARRDELFYDWSTSLGGEQGRYVRVRSLRPTVLHLIRVEVQ